MTPEDRALVAIALADWSFEHGDDRRSQRAGELALEFQQEAH